MRRWLMPYQFNSSGDQSPPEPSGLTLAANGAPAAPTWTVGQATASSSNARHASRSDLHPFMRSLRARRRSAGAWADR